MCIPQPFLCYIPSYKSLWQRIIRGKELQITEYILFANGRTLIGWVRFQQGPDYGETNYLLTGNRTLISAQTKHNFGFFWLWILDSEF